MSEPMKQAPDTTTVPVGPETLDRTDLGPAVTDCERASIKKKRPPNPHCPVAGCGVKRPHVDDPIVNGLIRMFGSPVQMTFWALNAMLELRDSTCSDLRENRLLAFQARLRQPEELYVRTLYALFIATDEELTHIISGDRPNGLYGLYTEVNRVVFDGGGALLVRLPGLSHGDFTPYETLNDGAHVSFSTFAAVIGWRADPKNVPTADRHWKYLTAYCDSLNYMHEMFRAGKEKPEILTGVKKFHRPAAHSTVSPTPAS